jgi:hypothetical protein
MNEPGQQASPAPATALPGGDRGGDSRSARPLATTTTAKGADYSGIDAEARKRSGESGKNA